MTSSLAISPPLAKENKVSTRARIRVFVRVARPTTALRSCIEVEIRHESTSSQFSPFSFVDPSSIYLSIYRSIRGSVEKNWIAEFLRKGILRNWIRRSFDEYWRIFNAWRGIGRKLDSETIKMFRRRGFFLIFPSFGLGFGRWPSDSSDLEFFPLGAVGYFHLPWIINEAAVQRWFLRTSFGNFPSSGLKTRPDLIRANRDGRARLAGFYFPRIRGATRTI